MTTGKIIPITVNGREEWAVRTERPLFGETLFLTDQPTSTPPQEAFEKSILTAYIKLQDDENR